MKKCRQCKQSRNIEDFHKDYKCNDGRSLRCRYCAIERSKKWYAANRGIDYARKGRARHLRKYWPGSTVEEAETNYNNLIIAQNNKCKICNREEKSIEARTNKIRLLCIDHNHRTGKVRGLLCNRCNKCLGQLEDDKNLLYTMINYLEQNSDKELL